ncbi:MAG: molybdate transport system regulatory protein [Thiomicrorhabdus sp.]|nr:MAG: molybdate transport system regulatory protein [Thiomicrorhabdus sp.]
MVKKNEKSSSIESVKKLPGKAYTKNIRARFWITGPDGSYIGIGRIELLEHIIEEGSISKAAKRMAMSYKKAWKLIEELNKLYDEPLVVKEQGGKQGGGTHVTVRGLLMIEKYRQLESELSEFLQSKSSEF